MSDCERREASDVPVPGFGRVGGIDLPRSQSGDDRENIHEEAAERDDRRAELLDLPDELRGEVRSYYDGEMETEGFVRRIRSIASKLERHADVIEARDEQADVEDGERR